MSTPTGLVQKLWNYCNILRDDGLSYGDYVEQLTFGSVAPAPSGFAPRFAQPVSLATGGSALLFLKMADEQARPPFNKPSPIPEGADWPALLAKDGDELESSGARWTAAGSPQGQRGGADQIHYRHTLEELGKRSGMLGVMLASASACGLPPSACALPVSAALRLRKAQNKIQDPANWLDRIGRKT
jgi:type I restriction enzyme M protein